MKTIDDEEANDYQPSPIPKSEENQRFAKEKETFRQKYKEQIDQVGHCLHNIYSLENKFYALFSAKISLANTSN